MNGSITYRNLGYNEGFADGYAEKASNATISYTYHTHTGNSSTKGGCYTVAVTCGGTVQWKLDSSSCYLSLQGNKWGNCHNVDYSYVCSTHGCYYNSSKGQMSCDCPGHYECKSCGKNYGSVYISKCNATRSYTVGCGKTTDTIESATIVFN